MMNESESKSDRASLIPHHLFVAWSRDSDHKSIHYLSTGVQGSSTSWLDQACKWCMHFPVQIYKTDIQHLQELEPWKQKVSGRPNGPWFARHVSVFRTLGEENDFFVPNHVFCINIWWYQENNNLLLLVGEQMCPQEVQMLLQSFILNKENKTSIWIVFMDMNLILYKICKPNWWLYSRVAIADKRTEMWDNQITFFFHMQRPITHSA